MPKLAAFFTKTYEREGKTEVKYAPGKPVEINGQAYWLDLYANTSENPNAPAFTLYAKEAAPKV